VVSYCELIYSLLLPSQTACTSTPLADGWFTVYYKGIGVYQFSEGTGCTLYYASKIKMQR